MQAFTIFYTDLELQTLIAENLKLNGHLPCLIKFSIVSFSEFIYLL